MKQLFKKNQIMVTALVVMIAVAGYLNYSGRLFGGGEEAQETGGEVANEELLDVSLEDTPGDAVLTNGDVSGIVAEAKLTREQVRAANKETLLEIINNGNLSDAQKEDALAQMLQMTEIAEMEATIETMLVSKGFSEAVVSLTADSADVVIHSEELTDANRAQIEDIVSRKSGIEPENIVITPVYE